MEKKIYVVDNKNVVAEVTVDTEKQSGYDKAKFEKSNICDLPGVYKYADTNKAGEAVFVCEINAGPGCKCDGCLQDECDKGIPCEQCGSRTPGEEIEAFLTGVVKVEIG